MSKDLDEIDHPTGTDGRKDVLIWTRTPSPAAPIELALPSGAVVRFPAGTGADVLVAVLRGVGDGPC